MSEHETSDSEYYSEEDDEKIEINTQITTTSIRSFYDQFLKNNNLLLNPEYQRDFCWSKEKMCTFINTIMKNWLVPNFVVYKLSKSELSDNEHSYECIDGQHRLKTIKYFIENDNLYWKNNNERIMYNNDSEILKDLSKRTKTRHRNFTKEEFNTFNDYQLCINIITSNNKKPLNIKTKCSIFNLLQNGEKVATYVKLRNLQHPVTTCIRQNKLLDFINDIHFINKLNIRKMRNNLNFLMFYLIKTFLILDKKNLEMSFLDINIKKYLHANEGEGFPITKIKNNIDELLINVKEILLFICNNPKIELIIIELSYIFICIYANYGLEKLDNLIKIKDVFNKYNDIKKYKNNNDMIKTYYSIIKLIK